MRENHTLSDSIKQRNVDNGKIKHKTEKTKPKRESGNCKNDESEEEDPCRNSSNSPSPDPLSPGSSSSPKQKEEECSCEQNRKILACLKPGCSKRMPCLACIRKGCKTEIPNKERRRKNCKCSQSVVKHPREKMRSQPEAKTITACEEPNKKKNDFNRSLSCVKPKINCDLRDENQKKNAT